jgi:glucose dehydrogenase
MRLIRSKFERWLKSKAADDVVGYKRGNCGCPLAQFHSAASRCEVVISSDRNGYGYVIDRGDGDRKLPAWADAFAFLVDGEPTDKISAARAIEILAQVSA